jgi:hypothetical protein
MSAGFPTLQGSFATTSIAAGGSPMTINLPSGITANELLVLLIARRSSAGTGLQTFTLPAGWTKVPSLERVGPNGALRYTFEVYWKIATGSEGATMSVSSSLTTNQNSCAICGRFDSYKTSGGNPVFDVGTWAKLNNGNWDAPSLSPAAGIWNYLWWAVCIEESTINAIGYPSGWGLYNNTVQAVAASVTGLRITFASLEARAATENPPAASSSSVAWDANTFTIQSSTSGAALARSQAIFM